MRSIETLATATIVALALAAPACSSTTTSGGAGLSVTAPATLTTGVCATFTIHYVLNVDGSMAVATSDQSYHVTAASGAVFRDSACATPLTGDAVIPAGSNAVDIGFLPSTAGVSSGIMVVSVTDSLLTGGAELVAH